MTYRLLPLAPLTVLLLLPDPAPVRANDGGELATVEAQVKAAIEGEADPCVDFYEYACGGWIENTPLPADRAVYGRGFSSIDDRNQDILKGILEKGEGDPRLASYYGSCMDTAAVDAAGVTALADELALIDGYTGPADLPRILPGLTLADVFFGAFVDSDLNDPNVYVLHLAQGGLGLPERGYYFPKDQDGKDKLAAYKAHVAKMLGFLGRPATDADAVLKIETALAKVSKPRDALRDATLLNHPMDDAGLEKLTSVVPWKALMAAYGVPAPRYNVMTPEFFTGLGKVLKKAKPDEVKAYLRWRTISAAANYLTTDIEAESFAFYGQTLSGQKVQRDRWKRCVDLTDAALGEQLGKAYVDQAFAGESKAVAQQMIKDIEDAFAAGLPELAWMDDATRKAALDKLHTIVNKIGYPDTLETYPGLEVGSSFLANAEAVAKWGLADKIKRVGGQVDKSEWLMSPPTVNAYYNPSWNEIVFPAGILQPPFFSANFPIAMNYGAMGMVMGHEVTHGFDDEGRKFAPDGSLKEWWAPEVSKRFEEQAACIVDTYSKVEVKPGLNLNGQLTLGENIADFGGIKLAYDAYTAWKARGNEEVDLGGFTPEQQFFLGYAQSWCSVASPQIEELRARTDPHSPPRQRVNIPLAHLPAFGEAFSCEVGQPMRPEKVCSVW